MNIQDALKNGSKLLSESSVYMNANPSIQARLLDSEVLLGFSLRKARTYLKAWPEAEVSPNELELFMSLIKKRAMNYPCAYLTGEQEFWSLAFNVNEDVLIPRPETECLVEFILTHFSANTDTLNGLDLGTGSGAIAIALASERKVWNILAIDQSEKALKCAKNNAEKHSISNISFLENDWLLGIKQCDFDFIISNPPYVEEHAPELEKEAIRFEPRMALTSGKDGLDAINIICSQSMSFLKTGSPLVIEHGCKQADDVKSIFENAGFIQVRCYKDYSQLDRFTVGFKP